MRTRYLIIINLLHGRSPTPTAGVLHVSRATVYHVAERFREWGEAGLSARREE
ncbi:MAG: helix-turn-helix domain-containing protein, partial [Planctomycetaceae bacterium]